MESLVRTLAEHLQDWGGRPLLCVFDRPKVRPEELALRIPVYVGPTGTVQYDGHAYSMPPEAISMPATLFLFADHVRIVAGRYKAEHLRKFASQESSWLAEHRAALVASVSGKRGKRDRHC